MNIGEASEKSGLPAKTIRYYEEANVAPAPMRSASGYRDYSENDVHLLRFIHTARRLGFSLEECRELVSLYTDPRRASADVKAIAERKIADIDRKLKNLKSMKRTLTTLINKCHGDDRPDCPILKGLTMEEESTIHEN
ncbi:Cu(I)-responsive transcriptional regulator [Hyphococcus sp.]|jgi:Cu(I)-responsive transcriptional regulator|uniref:Cu(I)-responsive transcriptional regulator n=1 Tax=Hyphococcus sp. TaxID=2038636 RepID=UPI003D1192EE